jgi:flagellar hook-associated protein 1 FlgK
MVGKDTSLDDYFADAAGRIGILHEQSQTELETNDHIVKNLTDMRASISGVNMDEELADMLKFQHGYAAAARFMSTVNAMLDVVLRLGASV